MRRNSKELDAIVDKTMADIRSESVDPKVISEAAARVWSQVSAENRPAVIHQTVMEHIGDCADFQSLIPAFLNGELSEARSLLLRDHTHECVPCRRAMNEAKAVRGGTQRRSTAPVVKTPFLPRPVIRWAIAATVILAVGLLALPVIQRYVPFGGALDTTVLAAEGSVYQVSDSGNRSLAPGAKIGRGDVVRTAKDGHAVLKLADGSTVELKDRSELSIDKNGRDTTIHLDRGNVIVHAAKQVGGQLYVATDDALVGVKGTIFSVNRGVKGSRVSVVEGQVRLDHAGTESLLNAGEQGATNPALEAVPVQDEISWSRDAAKYLDLLSQISAVRKELNRVAMPGVRYSTTLLDLMPDNTVFYAAVPNLAQSIAESNRIIEARIAQNPALRSWWETKEGGAKGLAGMQPTIEKIRQFGEVLGDEIAVGAEMDSEGKPVGPLVLAALKDSAGFRKLLDEQLKAAGTTEKGGPKVVIVEDLFNAQPSAADANKQLYIWIHDNLLVATPRLQQLQAMAVRVQSGEVSQFQTSPFHQRIGDVYHDGAGILVAADLEKIIATQVEGNSALAQDKHVEGLKQLGVTDLKYFVAEQKENQGKSHSRAMLGFNQSGKGITSWLAAPGPMGSLNYISPDANVVAAFVVKQPVGLVDDLLGFIETAAPDFGKHLKQAEAEHNLDLRSDIAAPLGGEFAFAIDGPILPTPSWKMVFEVNDPVRMQQSVERVVAEVNKEGAKHGLQLLAWDNSDVDGRTFYKIRSVQFGLEVNYAFVNGYLVAAPSRALVDLAIRYHDSNVTLRTSKRFLSTLPSDGNANFSAIFYHDLAPLIAPIAQRLAENGAGGTDDRKRAIAELAADTPPTLAYAYAYGDRIIVAADTEGGPFGLGPASLMGMPNALGIQQILQSAIHGYKK
jgi:DNA-binding FrmR family transcriptional regulator